jgi:phosphoglycolate phosphatase
MRPADGNRAATAPASILVLFDIDGTLIRTGGAGVRGMDAAFERLHGRSGALHGVRVGGRTDRAILTEVFGKWDEVLNEADIPPLRDHYLEELSRELTTGGGPGFGVLPGVMEALDLLESDPAFVVGLLTGNFERGAEIKLARFDLWHRFAFGAFGDAHVSRRDLVPVARARAHDRGLAPSHVVIIGDTPLDVDCAHAHGAYAVAVATGDYSVGELDETGADIVAPTLTALHPIAIRLKAMCAREGFGAGRI